MKRKTLIIAGVLILVGVIVVSVGLWYCLGRSNDTKNSAGNSSSANVSDELLTEVQEGDVFVEGIENYDQVGAARTEGNVVVKNGGKIYEIDVEAKTSDMTEAYIGLTMKDELVHIYAEDNDGILYLYVSDGTDTVRFVVEDGSETEEIYNEVNGYSPDSMMESLDDEYDDDGGDPDVEVEYKGVVECHDLMCHKYIVTDNSTGQLSTLTIWLDTEDRLPRILKLDSDDMTAALDIYYDDVNFEMPDEYDEINIDTFWGLQQLYAVLGGFVDLLV